MREYIFVNWGKKNTEIISNQEHKFPARIKAKTKCHPCKIKNEWSE